MNVTHVTDSPAGVVETETTLLEDNLETIDSVHYIPSVDSDTQMTRYKDKEARNN